MSTGITSAELSRQYTSFGGVDIIAVVEGQPIGTLQAISYAVQREKAPIYVMGRVDPLSFSRGKRGIAGTIITLMLDTHMIFRDAFKDMYFLADKDEIYPNPTSLTDVRGGEGEGGTGFADLLPLNEEPVDAAGNIAEAYQVTPAWYVDQLPPFDIAIVAVNEYGKSASMRIYGVEILNEGSGFSIDDMTIENQSTYVCRTILPWQPLGSWDMNPLGTGGFSVSPAISPVDRT